MMLISSAARSRHTSLLTCGAAAIAILSAAPASAQIYSWRDANGHLVLANSPQPGAAAIVKSYPVPASASIRTTSQVSRDRALMYDGLINEHARLNDVRPDLVRAVV